MTPLSVALTILAWFALSLGVSYLAGRGTGKASDFFNAGGKTPWWVVAVAMIGAPMSGVTFVSVPGMVGTGDTAMSYMQMALGFFVGYVVIAYVLIHVFFRLGVVSIYQYLQERFGIASHKTGAWFFFISKALGASVRLFLVCAVLQQTLFGPLGIPFAANAAACVLVTLAYTFRGGVRSVLWTDTLKTVCMLASVVLFTVFIAQDLGTGVAETVRQSKLSRIFFFDDPAHPRYFWKQFLAGIFTVVAMTGLDQDLMQRTLSSRNVSDSRKNLIVSGLLQIPVIFLFLCLGVMLYTFADARGIDATADGIFPAVATSGQLPAVAGVLFILGLVSCAFSSGGSALTALTTSFTTDILGAPTSDVSTRKKVHLGMTLLMVLLVIGFYLIDTQSVIDMVYRLASYTYGPLLGMFAFGLASRRKVRDKWVPLVALIAPALCLVLQLVSVRWLGGWRFGYELILINAILTAAGLWLLSEKAVEPELPVSR